MSENAPEFEPEIDSDARVPRPEWAKGKKGLWKGHPNPGRMRAGYDPRRQAKSEQRLSFEQMCREALPGAVEQLTAALDDEDLPFRDKLAAFSLLADHGVGKPVDRVAIANLNGTSMNPSELSTEVLEQRVAALLNREGEGDQPVLDARDIASEPPEPPE